MTDWDGTGLPPAAQARIDRAAVGRLTSSLLSIKGDAALTSVGLDPVGEVMGSVVNQLGWAGWGGCGFTPNYLGGMRAAGRTFGSRYGGYSIPAAPVTSGQSGRWSGFAPYVRALYHGYETALHRMLLEAQALDGDGVVGATVTRERLDANVWEYVVRGTAVRARSRQRPTHLFSTDQSGADVAKLMHAGWMPVSLMWGISVAVRHDDYITRLAGQPWNQMNIEVPGYTDLAIHTRADARHQFENKVAKYGADSAIVSNMSLNIWGMPCQSGGTHDHVAEAVIVGTGLAQFHHQTTARTNSLLVMPLGKG
jgi:uncharacterized protein YbjQ (UPF0145 family)